MADKTDPPIYKYDVTLRNGPFREPDAPAFSYDFFINRKGWLIPRAMRVWVDIKGELEPFQHQILGVSGGSPGQQLKLIQFLTRKIAGWKSPLRSWSRDSQRPTRISSPGLKPGCGKPKTKSGRRSEPRSDCRGTRSLVAAKAPAIAERAGRLLRGSLFLLFCVLLRLAVGPKHRGIPDHRVARGQIGRLEQVRACFLFLAQIPERVSQVVVRLRALRPLGHGHEKFAFSRFKLAHFVVADTSLVVFDHRGRLAAVRGQRGSERRWRIHQRTARHRDGEKSGKGTGCAHGGDGSRFGQDFQENDSLPARPRGDTIGATCPRPSKASSIRSL